MRILMPVDASEHSKAAVAFVASRATLLKNPTEVHLINLQSRVPVRAARALGKEMVYSYYEAEAAKALKAAAAALKRAGANAAARYVVGTVAHDLGSIVANDRADLIVMGSHGDTGLKKLLLGSVASTVAVACNQTAAHPARGPDTPAGFAEGRHCAGRQPLRPCRRALRCRAPRPVRRIALGEPDSRRSRPDEDHGAGLDRT